MEWIRALKVGDKFLYHTLSHYAIVEQLRNNTISYTWYRLENNRKANFVSGSNIIRLSEIGIPISSLMLELF